MKFEKKKKKALTISCYSMLASCKAPDYSVGSCLLAGQFLFLANVQLHKQSATFFLDEFLFEACKTRKPWTKR